MSRISCNLANVRTSYRRVAGQVVRHPDELRLLFSTTSYKEEEILDRHLPESGAVMDLGFGLSRHFAYLLEKGLHVFGIDQSPEFAAVVKREFPEVEIIVDDMTEEASFAVVLEKVRFNTVICLGNSLGGVFTAAGQQQVARLCWRLVGPGGKVVVNCSQGLRVWSGFSLFGISNEDPLTQIARGQIQILEKDFRAFTRRRKEIDRSIRFAQYYPTREEIILLFQKVGFAYIDTSGQYYNYGSLAAEEILVFQKN